MDKVEHSDDVKIILGALRNLINDEPHREAKWEKDFIFATGHYRVEYHAKQDVFVIEQRLFDRVEAQLDPWAEEWTLAQRKAEEQKPEFARRMRERVAANLEQVATNKSPGDPSLAG